VIDAAAPSSSPLISPVAWKALIDTGGRSALRGLRWLGRDLAGTPGAVVARSEIWELMHYAPVLTSVHR